MNASSFLPFVSPQPSSRPRMSEGYTRSESFSVRICPTMFSISIRHISFALVGFVLTATCPSWAAAQDKPADISQLRLPEGFVVERVASAPLVEHPMMAGFDEKGRLFVAESAG